MAMDSPARLGASTHSQINSLPGEEVSQIKTGEEQKVKRMNLNVPIDLHNSFKATTAAKGLNMTDVLMEFIKSYVAKNASKGRRR
jgi:hypothetical protein